MKPPWCRNSTFPKAMMRVIVWTALCGAAGARVAAASEGPDAIVAAPLTLPADTVATLVPPAPESTGSETKSFFATLGSNLVDDVKHLPRINTVYWAAGGGALALAVHPADQAVNRHLTGSSGWDTFFKPGHIIGATEVQIAAGMATYAIGRYRDANEARHIGMDLMEADILTEGIVQVMKYSVRRERPPNPDGTPNSDKSPSFPSGHAAITFAGATVLQQHFGWKAAVPTYLIASYVALSRLHDNVHYLSDIVFGATTGIIVGRAVTWHGRNNFPIQPVVSPDLMGLVIEWR